LRIHAHNAKLVSALQAGQPLTTCSLARTRFSWYDDLLLHILTHFPARGPAIFSALFRDTDFRTILRFLSEKTGIREEVDIFRHLPIGLFLRATWNHSWTSTAAPMEPTLPGAYAVQLHTPQP